MTQSNRNGFAIAAGLCLCASMWIGTGAIAQRSTPSLPANMDALTKREKHDAMIAIAHQQRELRATMRIDPAAAALYEQLGAAYQQMSESLGGDDPGRAVRIGRFDGRAVSHTTSDDGGLAGSGFIMPGCAFQFGQFTNTAPVAIGDLQTVTYPVTVSGLPNFVAYMDVSIAITHGFSADLDITVTSPSGTTVTLSSDNGLANSFGPTQFANQFNPGGTVPYANNNGLITDHNYGSGGAVAQLVPEESLTAFNGEDPNGQWILTVTDDAPLGTGTLHAFSVSINASPEVRTQTTRGFTHNTAVPMPAPTALISSNINVAGMPGGIHDINVFVDLDHTYNEDVQMTLTSPEGRVVTLTSNNGGSNDNIFSGVSFDDQADAGAAGARLVTDTSHANNVVRARLVPEEPLGIFRAISPNGTWTLTIADTFPGLDGGTLQSWGMTIASGTCDNACPSDINGDGAVNVTDLLAIISAWGDCVP